MIDGLTRDSTKIMEMGFPVFTRGYSPLDSKGRMEVISYGISIRCGGVLVRPGDIVFGDHDGVVVIPEHVSDEVLLRAGPFLTVRSKNSSARLHASRSTMSRRKK